MSAREDALRQRFHLIDDPRYPEALTGPEGAEVLRALCDALESGEVSIVRRGTGGAWTVAGWIKRALVRLSAPAGLARQPGPLPGSELPTLGWTMERPTDRRVPAGSTIRRGAFIAPGSVVMPPSTVQVGAAICAGAAVDSHVLVGSGVWVGEGAAVGCGTMLGGSLSPEDALPVILERGALVGGNCGLYGSIVVGEGSAIFAGSILRAAAGMFDAKNRRWIEPDAAGTLWIPAGSSVGMGAPPPEVFPDGISRISAILN